MILSIYNFKLYYPDGDPEYSSGGEGGEESESSEGEESEGSSGATSTYVRDRRDSRGYATGDQDQLINRTDTAKWNSTEQNEGFDFDTPTGPGPIRNTSIDLEKRAESRRIVNKRLDREKDYGDNYSGDGDEWGKEKRRRPNRKDYGKVIPPKTKYTEYKKQLTGFTIEGFGYSRSRPIRQDGEVRIIKVVGTPKAVFSITIKDSEECSILEKELQNIEIPSSGKYILRQKFPSIYSDEGVARTEQYYDVRLEVAADIYISNSIDKFYTLRQYKDPSISFSKTYTTTDLPDLTLAGADVSLSGTVDSSSGSTSTYTLTIQDASSGTRLYVKNRGFKNNLITNTSFTKKVDRCGNTGSSSNYTFETITTKSTVVDTEISRDIDSDIKNGMQLTGQVVTTKNVMALLDKDQNVIQTGSCSDKRINKFKLTDTNDLTTGMLVYFKSGETSIIRSIDCNQNITLGGFYEVNCNETFTFVKEFRAKVINVITNNNSKGKSEVELDRGVDIPHGTIVTFDDNKTILKGNVSIGGSGNTAADTANQLKLTAILDVKRFGTKDVTYSFDLDKILSIKPNAYDQNIVISKDSSGFAINMIKFDRDTNRTGKTGVIVKPPSHGSVGAYNTSNDTFTYTPNAGFVGKDFFTFQMKDDANTLSEVKTICIKVLGVSNPVDSQRPKDSRSGTGAGGGYTALIG
tara:strand:- start:791 stop:2860 length:2070 start_codon:yes stop_codon:yes gene_type:complete